MIKLKAQPLKDRVIIKQLAAEEKTKGGIFVIEDLQEKPNIGIVLAAGPGKKDEPMTVKVGDKVMFAKFGGQVPETIEDQEVLIMRESDIMLIY